MSNKLFLGALMATAVCLSGCAGTDFVRPAEGELAVGKATQAEVLQRMGAPYQTGEITKNEKQLKLARYAYAATGGEPTYEGVVPARSIGFAFYNDIVVSQEFMSSFKSDSTDFDENKVSQIVKGKSTRQDVIALLGKPTGTAVFPIIKGANDQAIIYGYNQVKGSVFNMKFYSKNLVVSFNNNGIVTDVEYTAVGEK